jgi:TM2 domain-containing membrane protein YozV
MPDLPWLRGPSAETPLRHFKCNDCGLVMFDDGRYAGELVECPRCRQSFRVGADAPPVDRPVRPMPPRVGDPGVAAALSFFAPGAGQVYLGEISKGICWFIVFGVFVAAAAVFAWFLIVVPVGVWIWAVNDAYGHGRWLEARAHLRRSLR